MSDSIYRLIPQGHPAQAVLIHLAEIGIRLNDYQEVATCLRASIRLGHVWYNNFVPATISLYDHVRVTIYEAADQSGIVHQQLLEYSDPEMLDRLDVVLGPILPESDETARRMAERCGW